MMRQYGTWVMRNYRLLVTAGIVLACLAWLLLYHLGRLPGNLSSQEAAIAAAPVGWHGIYHQPLYLPLKIVQSFVFWLWPAHGAALSRLPNALFGGLTVLEFLWLIRLWHGTRTAFLGGLLFASAAWTLHASRLVSYDVLYLWLLPTLLLIHFALKHAGDSLQVWFVCLVTLLLILYLPGAIWLLLAAGFLLGKSILIENWRSLNHTWQKSVSGLLFLGSLPLLIIDLARPGQLKLWLGLPAHFVGAGLLAKQFAAVPGHLFVRGPQYPDLWLGKAPLLDVFTLAVCLVGLYFYATRFASGRSRLLATFFAVGWILTALGGPFSLSFLVALLYAIAATGLAFYLREWLKYFPVNPVARGTGVFIICLLVASAVFYNLRAYFVAWPHNPVTRAVFHRPD